MLAADGWLLFAPRGVRLFAYGLVSVILVLYLEELDLSSARIGALLNLPFFLAGGCKLVYDLLQYREFRATEPKD